MLFANGDKYSGGWLEDLRSGFGTLEYNSTTNKTVSGLWYNGVLQ